MPEIDAGDEICTADSVCDDGRFCNGTERCSPDAAGADARGCVPGEMACGAGVACDEATRECAGPCSEPDADGDGHAAIACGGDDCDDTDPDRFPSSTEICDLEGHDEDCDPTTFGLRDLDGDRIDDARCCNTSDDGTTYCGEDCDDTRRGTNPNVPEVCDGRDNDCDGSVDEEVSVAGFADTDRDLHGDVEAPISGCPGWPGVSASSLDCDDSDPTINGPQTEILDGSDNDCDGEIDEEVQRILWYPDIDGDGFGDADANDTLTSDRPLPNRSILPFDCDDADPSRGPHAEERCNAVDDDCNPATTFMLDVNDSEDDDGDGWPDANCRGIVARRADCDDTDGSTYPGAPERCDGHDNDCDGVVDERCSDPSDAGIDGGPNATDAGGDSGATGEGDGGVDTADAGVDSGPPGAGYVVEVAAGHRHTCARREAGEVLCWGDNEWGQLGDGTRERRLVPTPVLGLSDVVGSGGVSAIAAGYAHTCAIRNDRSVVCWGSYEERGDGTRAGSLVPTPVIGVTNAGGIFSAGHETCADQVGTVVCWAWPSMLPIPVNGLTDAREVCSGVFSFFEGRTSIGCARRGVGSVVCWGTDRVPIPVDGLADVTEISGRDRHLCAIQAGGSTFCWGRNFYGQLGVFDRDHRDSPTAVIDMRTAVHVATGEEHTCAYTASGATACWGDNSFGQLGIGAEGSYRTTPVWVAGLPTLTLRGLSAGGHHTCATAGELGVFCWGSNDRGQLGDGTLSNRAFIERVIGL
jgi:hypothetical protein